LGDWTLTSRARYEITGRILVRMRYRYDAWSEVAPLDLSGLTPLIFLALAATVPVGIRGFLFLFWSSHLGIFNSCATVLPTLVMPVSMTPQGRTLAPCTRPMRASLYHQWA
jgi:hypothetical protein